MTLALIQYVDSLPNGFAGMTDGPWVRILATKKNDAGLLAHEVEGHVNQFWIGVLAALPWIATFFLLGGPSDLRSGYAVAVGLLCVVLFAVRKKLTLMAEVAAYRVQLQYSPNDALIFAGFISTRYGLDITPDEALKLLTE